MSDPTPCWLKITGTKYPKYGVSSAKKTYYKPKKRGYKAAGKVQVYRNGIFVGTFKPSGLQEAIGISWKTAYQCIRRKGTTRGGYTFRRVKR